MLLVPTRLGSSEIHGLGVFCVEPIRSGTVVWEFTPGHDVAHRTEILETLTPVQREQFLRYSYLDSRTSEYICCADDGRFMNHSSAPNTVEFYANADDRYGANVAARDIEPGEELTCDYFSFDLEAGRKLGASPSDAPVDRVGPCSSDRHSIHYLHPALKLDDLQDGDSRSVVAMEPVPRGAVLTVWGGEVLAEHEVQQLSASRRVHSVQVDERLFLVPHREIGPADCFNHSCDPNAGLQGQICLIALRDIQTGEQVCYDYAMSDGSPYDEFDCNCGTALCRGRVTGNDWKRPELQERYGTCFSPYLLRRMKRPDC